MSQHNTPEITILPAPGYEAARTGAAIEDRRDRGRLVVSGADRASYLQGMLSNDIVALRPGQGCYACYLTAQGRMISDMWVFELGDIILLSVPGSTRATVLSRLDQFIFSEDARLGDVSETFASIAVLGPAAARTIAAVVDGCGAETLASLPEAGNLRVTRSGDPAIIVSVGDAGVTAYELLIAAAQFESTWQALMAAGAEVLAPEAAESLRIEAGIPRFHQDMDEETIPLEANLEARAISQSKGCYVGQEVIIRVLHRGHGRVAKKLVGFTIEGGDPPPHDAAGAIVRAGEREIGRVTSAVRSPALQRLVALGYVHRDFVSPGTAVTVGGVPAVVTTLPFVP